MRSECHLVRSSQRAPQVTDTEQFVSIAHKDRESLVLDVLISAEGVRPDS